MIDYNKEDFTKVLADIDAVFDTVGGSVAERSFAVLKPGGRAAFIFPRDRRNPSRAATTPLAAAER